MTGLLVSVRDASEALAALYGGADIIDIKEPLNGALGAAELSVWRAVTDIVAGARPVSAALGELQDGATLDRARQADGMRFAKIGLSRSKDDSAWQDRWHTAIKRLPQGVACAQ